MAASTNFGGFRFLISNNRWTTKMLPTFAVRATPANSKADSCPAAPHQFFRLSMTTETAVRAVPNETSPSGPLTKTVRVVIKGRVQGVFYRDWTVENASQLALTGWVRNRRDGSVEALFSGSLDKVEEMEQRCRRGPPDAMVTGFQVFPANEEHPGTTFQRKPTT